MKLKLPKSKKAVILSVTVAILVITGSAASAALPSIGSAFSDLIKAEKLSVFGLPSEKIASYVQSDGKINFNTIFSDVSKRAYDAIKGDGNGDSAWVKTAGEQMADFNQDRAEISHQTNTQSTADGVKFFQDNADQVKEVTTTNETPSDSSLEAADKHNKLAAANVMMNQQLTKATLDLTTAQQNQNTLEIERGQKERTDRLKNQINSSFAENEVERLQAVARRRFYPDANGNMVEGGK
jgi:hypothetical protein